MNSRIFPTQKNENIERSTVVNTIDLKNLSEKMDKMSNIDKKDMTKTASAKTSGDRKKKRYSMKSTICSTCGVEHPCSCDIIAAQANGEHEKVASMMEVRANRRMANIQAIEEQIAQEELNQRTAFRANLLNTLEKFASDENEMTEEACGGNVFGKCSKCGEDECVCKPCPDCKGKPCKCKDGKFEKVDKMSSDKKSYFAKYAEAMGWPEEYVIAVTKESIKLASIPDATKLILSNSKLSSNNKKQLVIAMHKEAKLTSEQANRIKTYWKDELNYPDTEWIDDLVDEPTGK